MAWTKERPTEEGEFYWMRSRAERPAVSGLLLPGDRFVVPCYEPIPIDEILDEWPDTEWMGPIHPGDFS